MNNRNEILRTLENRWEELRSFGVRRLSLFGSAARDGYREGNDLDFLVEFEEKSFDAYMDLKQYLEDLFGCEVDLVLPSTLKPRLKHRILADAVDVARP